MGVAKMTKYADPHKCFYTGFGDGFHACSLFSFLDKSVFILGVENSSAIHVDFKKKKNLVLCEGSTQGLGNAEITAEAIC